MKEIRFRVNGAERAVTTEESRPLLEVLREDLGLTGAKYGCGEGRCGACTVIVDGSPTRSCVTPVGDVEGKAVTTIEGLAPAGGLHPVQEAFIAAGAVQCGYCTPGMVLAAASLLAETPSPTDEQILDALDFHLCRCCGYPKILEAVRRAAARSGR